MIKTIKTYLSGFKIKRCTTLSFFILIFAFFVFTNVNRPLTHYECLYLKEGFQTSLIYFNLLILFIKILILRELDMLFDIVVILLMVGSQIIILQ